MQETLRHQEAFEHYYGLGDEIKIDAKIGLVASKHGVTKKTIYQWKKSFNWDERKRNRDTNNAQKLAEKTNTLVVDAKSKYLILIKDTLLEYRKALKSGNIRYNVRDLETLAKLELLLREGETTTGDRLVNITIVKDDQCRRN
jgi:transposase